MRSGPEDHLGNTSGFVAQFTCIAVYSGSSEHSIGISVSMRMQLLRACSDSGS